MDTVNGLSHGEVFNCASLPVLRGAVAIAHSVTQAGISNFPQFPIVGQYSGKILSSVKNWVFLSASPHTIKPQYFTNSEQLRIATICTQLRPDAGAERYCRIDTRCRVQVCGTIEELAECQLSLGEPCSAAIHSHFQNFWRYLYLIDL
jgi:hypothetical protein